MKKKKKKKEKQKKKESWNIIQSSVLVNDRENTFSVELKWSRNEFWMFEGDKNIVLYYTLSGFSLKIKSQITH